MKKLLFLTLILGWVFWRGVVTASAVEPHGYADTANCQTISGWVYNNDAPPNTAIQVDLYDGQRGSGGTLLIKATADKPRPDLVVGHFVTDLGNHGMEEEMLNRLKDGRTHTIYFYAVGGSNPQLTNSPKTIQCVGNTTPTNAGNDTILDTEVNLTSINRGKIKLHITYEKSPAVGDPFPNYEYSGHIIKLASNDYRMIYGGRCVYDVNNNCLPSLVSSTNPPPEFIGQNTNMGDGDHPRYAQSSDGINWERSLVPLVRPGRFDNPPVPMSNYDYGNHMDPTVIQWQGTYYMYYQVEVRSDQNVNCPKDPKQNYSACDRILYATSTDLIHWTKGQPIGVPAITGAAAEDHQAWPKAMVVDGQVWLYFVQYKYGYTGTSMGAKLIKSNDPTKFAMTNAVSVNGFGGGGWQHGLLWPNDPNKRIWVGVTNNWDLTTSTGHKVPTMMFSKDGVNWTYGDSGKPVSFPSKMASMEHEFCNIATEVNGGISDGKTFYYCATTNGENNTTLTGIFNADIIVGRINFEGCTHKSEGDANCDDTITFTGDFPILANEITQQIATSTRADFNGDGKVNLQDFEILRKTLFPN